MKKEYIVYRHYENGIFKNTERLTLSKRELIDYLELHIGELMNIEIFKNKQRARASVTVIVR